MNSQDYVSVEALLKTLSHFSLITQANEMDVFMDQLVKYQEEVKEGKVKMPFGKYQGKTVDEVAAMDRSYLEWLLANNTSMGPDDKYNGELYFAIVHALERTA